MRLFFLFALIFVRSFLFAQEVANDSSAVIVHKDPRLDLLIKKQIEINEITSRDTRKNGKGFRLLIINTNKRDEAINAKTTLYKHFPELKSYLYYQSPYFKLKAGNFKERKDAEAYQKKLNRFFPKGVFVMADIIETKGDKGNEADDLEPLPQ
jgi:hypothetical protein